MDWFRQLRFRLSRLFNPRAADEDLAEEIRSHIEIETHENIARGMSPEEARRVARLKFGSLVTAREQSREVWGFVWLETLRRDLRYGARSLAKSPGFTAVAVLSLALGIGANTAIFSVFNAVLLRPLPFKDPDRLVTVHGRQRSVGGDVQVVWREKARIPELTSYASGYVMLGSFLLDGDSQWLRWQAVGTDLFSVLGTKPLLGRDFSATEDGEVIISHSLWQRQFGGAPDVIGRSIDDPSGAGVIVGVMPSGFWVYPWTADAEVWDVVKSPGGWMSPIARLKPGTTVEQAEAEINIVAENVLNDPAYAKRPERLEVRPFKRQIASKYESTLNLLLGAVGFVLLIGCVNVAVLLLGRATRRQKEISTRAALGAGRWRLVRQLTTESSLLAGMGGLFGALVAYAGIKLFTLLAPRWYLPSEKIALDGQVLAYTLGIALLTGILFGLAPALQSSKPDLNVALQEGSRNTTGDSRRRLRRLLAVSEVAIALTLLVGAGLMINSFAKLVTADRGFNQEGLLTMGLQLYGQAYWDEEHSRPKPEAAAFYERLLDRIDALPGVVSAGMNSYLFMGNTRGSGFQIVGRAESARAIYSEISEDFFTTMETPLLRGRLFTRQDTEDSLRVAIINQSLARKFFPVEDPIGKFLQAPAIYSRGVLSFEEPREIVGIVGNIINHVREEAKPGIFVPYRQYSQSNQGGFYSLNKGVVIRTAREPMNLADAARKAVSDTDPELTPTYIETMETAVANRSGIKGALLSGVSETQSLRFYVRLLSLFAGLALFLAVVGLFGVISYSVAQRTHEFGLRMALGAQRSDILRSVLKEGLVLSLLGLGIGVVASLGLTRLIESQLYGVTATDPATFAAVSAVLVGVVLLAAYIPGRRAASVDPMVAIRHE